jgi:hypothetical protein
MDQEKLKRILEEATNKGLFAVSGDAVADGHTTNVYVPVGNVEKFIEFVATHPLVVSSAKKPYVGLVYGLQRHRMMRVNRLRVDEYNIQTVNSNVLFPPSCIILDECDTHLCVLGNDNCKYWIKRFYFTGPVTEAGIVPTKKTRASLDRM